MARTRKTIKAELSAEVGKEHPDEGRVSELMAELRRVRGDGGRPRLRRARGADNGENSTERTADPGQDPDADAVKSWPSELRGGINPVIDRRPDRDPDGWGQRNDARRWSPWR